MIFWLMKKKEKMHQMIITVILQALHFSNIVVFDSFIFTGNITSLCLGVYNYM